MNRRWLIRSFFLLPILLCMAGWGWSTTHQVWAFWNHGDRYEFYTGWGIVELEWEHKTGAPDAWASRTSSIPPRLWPTDERLSASHLGFMFSHGVIPSAAFQMTLAVPYWFLIIVLALPLFLVWRATGEKKPARAFPVEAGGRA